GRSDVYSLGIVAYQALVGEVPYDGEDSFAIGYKHIMEPIPTPLLDTPEERRLFEIIKRMIQKDPRDRFQDADELSRALEAQPARAPAGPGPSLAQERLSVQATTPLPSLPRVETIKPESSRAEPSADQRLSRRSTGITIDTPRRSMSRRASVVQQ